MTLSNEKAVASDGRRVRSYSDTYAINYSKANSSHNSPGNADNATLKPNAPHHSKMYYNRKHPPSHHHHDNRLRSKSLDLHGIHKKKYPSQYKHIPLTYSPGRSHAAGRLSPSCPKLKGNMWIRPGAITTRDPVPLSPTIARALLPSPSPQEQQRIDDQGFTDLSSFDVSASACHASNNLSRSPTSFENDMMLYTAPSTYCDSSQQYGHGPARIIFGESGKPIKSHSVLGNITPYRTTTAL